MLQKVGVDHFVESQKVDRFVHSSNGILVTYASYGVLPMAANACGGLCYVM
jgi:hypothetical protein